MTKPAKSRNDTAHLLATPANAAHLAASIKQARAAISAYEAVSLAAALSVFDVDEPRSTDVVLQVQDYDGADAYNVRETTATNIAIRTAWRLDLATRLNLAPDYDPRDLVGRVFLLPAGV